MTRSFDEAWDFVPRIVLSLASTCPITLSAALEDRGSLRYPPARAAAHEALRQGAPDELKLGPFRPREAIDVRDPAERSLGLTEHPGPPGVPHEADEVGFESDTAMP